jgi:hypothetical protein
MLKYKPYVPEENPLEDFDKDFKQGKYKAVSNLFKSYVCVHTKDKTSN